MIIKKKMENNYQGTVLCGWLKKLGKKKTTWQKRWFELKNQTLSYYLDQDVSLNHRSAFFLKPFSPFFFVPPLPLFVNFFNIIYSF